ncbi:hypothetical protein [Rubritalea tangerina]
MCGVGHHLRFVKGGGGSNKSVLTSVRCYCDSYFICITTTNKFPSRWP